MRHVFIDCGSHDGCSIRKFRSLIDKEKRYELFSFEANPNLEKYYNNLEPKQTHHNKAVWIDDGYRDFYILGSCGAGTLNEAKKNQLERKNLSKKDIWRNFSRGVSNPNDRLEKLAIAKLHSKLDLEKIEVETIDLPKWIKNNFKKDDYIILKLDVEGAEYEIIKKLFEVEAIEYINEIFIEFHNERCGKTREDDRLLLDQIKAKGIEYDMHWDAMHHPYLIERECEEQQERRTQDDLKKEILDR